ncbi:MAG TPA: protein-glutamate O-methyltransferase CheR [bacterium]|nr:protein-glutamate O-methyltransferase CheR [bacterium]
MEKAVFDKFRSLIFETCGIFLTEQKEALVTARISKRMRALSVSDYDRYFHAVVSDKSGNELRELVNAISTNVTHFFREARHFDVLADLVRKASSNGQRSLRIWCAACSTGEEPYTIAMAVLEAMTRPLELEIIASDISTKVLQIAKFGVYREQDVRTVPAPLLKKYFQKGVGRAAQLYRVKQTLRNMVSYRQINLSTPPYPIEGNQDVIFCRNVMIYFNHDLRRNLVHHFEQMLRPQGHLFVGMAESLTGVHRNLTTVEPSVYRRG